MNEGRSDIDELEQPSHVLPEAPPTATERFVAFLEVLICSDYPTQIALAATFAAFGVRPQGDQGLSLSYVVTLSLADTLFLTFLIVYILRVRGESPWGLFFGGRSIKTEARAGVPLLFVAFGVAVVVLLAIRAIAPWLRTVPHNPLQDLVRTPGDAALFAVVLIVAGGLREEVQRAFLLRRFERWLGGPRVGLIATSVLFGAGHYIQGADAAIATAVLGAFWGIVYLRRQSIAAPVVSHAGFNLLQVIQFLTLLR
ncbi:MAG: CPBP family intramembrane glutamic endopeptidase [Vicinamibacterales bacterium]